MELGNSRFFSQDVSGKPGDVGICGRVFVHLWSVILYVDVVSNTEEFLAVFVGAGEEDRGHTNDVGGG